MEVPQKTWNHHEKKKMVIKIGGGGGGGAVGAVVLLGGALATAALASAFIVGKKGWSSSKDRRRHQSPPPEMRKQNAQDEANKGQQFVISHVYDHPRSVILCVQLFLENGSYFFDLFIVCNYADGYRMNWKFELQQWNNERG